MESCSSLTNSLYIYCSIVRGLQAAEALEDGLHRIRGILGTEELERLQRILGTEDIERLQRMRCIGFDSGQKDTHPVETTQHRNAEGRGLAVL